MVHGDFLESDDLPDLSTLRHSHTLWPWHRVKAESSAERQRSNVQNYVVRLGSLSHDPEQDRECALCRKHRTNYSSNIAASSLLTADSMSTPIVQIILTHNSSASWELMLFYT